MFLAKKLNKGAGTPATTDPQFNYVTMLLHGDGTNGAQNNTFIDSSSNNFTITRNGNTTQGSFSPYGSNWSNYFDGDGDYLTSTWSVIGANQFTCEAWVFMPSSANRYYIVAPGTDTASHYDGFGFEIQGQTLNMWASSNGSTWNLVESDGSQGKSANPVPLNTWTHVAMTRDFSGVFRSFINGKLECVVSPGTAALADSGTTVLNVGRTRYLGNFANFLGYMSNLRIVNGSIVTAYSTSSTTIGAQIFTPPTAPLTAITNTSFLTCQSNRFIDNSTNNYTVTPSGTPSVQRFNPFGASTAYSTSVIGGSAYIDNNGYLDCGSQSAYAFGTGDFTINTWIYPTSIPTFVSIMDTRGNGGNAGWALAMDTARTIYLYSAVGFSFAVTSASGAIPLNAWSYITVTRSGTSYTLYINGVSAGTGSGSQNFTHQLLTVGYSGASGGEYYYGYISNAQVIKGTAVAPTLPTAPVATSSGTSVLLNMQNAAIFDNAMMNDLETVGNAQISTSVKKYGTGSLAFDGSGDYLIGPSTPNMSFGAGDFTVEAWVYRQVDSGTTQTIYQKGRVADSNFELNFVINTSNQLEVYYSTSGTSATLVATTTASVSQNTWTHVAVARSGSTWRVFIGGTLDVSATASVTLYTGTGRISIATNPNGDSPFTGYIDDLRITKGYARYTTTFTPPSAAFFDTGPN